MDSVPIMQVYDQEKEVKRRDQSIKTINKNARNLNNIAREISTKVHEQDENLDSLNKELGQDLILVKKGNKELFQAKEFAKDNSKSICCIIVVLMIGLSVFGLIMYLTVFRKMIE